jgi:hypothetical protein
MSQIWTKPDRYYHYFSHHFVSNFNKKFKNMALEKLLDKMCQESSRWEFDIMYMIWLTGMIKLKNSMRLNWNRDGHYHMMVVIVMELWPLIF